jgi:ACT domain-containing protein
MMMIVDMTDIAMEFDAISEELEKLGQEVGVIIKAQREDIFDMMHRI